MGHNVIPAIPRTRRWREVVGLVADHASVEAVAAASTRAAERAFDVTAEDPVFAEAVHILVAVPGAVRQPDPVAGLYRLGIITEPDASLARFLTAVGAHLDDARPPSDPGELSRRALISAFAQQLQDPVLADSGPDALLTALGRFQRPHMFPVLSCAFFSRLVFQVLENWLGRILPTEVGPGRRFRDLADHASFEGALALHAIEAARVIEQFSAGWYGKMLRDDREISRERSLRYGAYALMKIRDELARRSKDDV